MKLEMCVKCGENTVEVILLNDKGTQSKSVCHTCDHEIQNPVICGGCGAPNDREVFEVLNCGFCGCADEAEEEEEEVYVDCLKCSNDFLESEDTNGTGLCEDCRDAYKAFGDDDLLEEICEEFGCYPHDVEYDRVYKEMTIEGLTYDVLDEDDVKEDLEDYFRDSVWTFSAWFLADQTGVDSELFKILQNSGECENTNQGILDIIEKTCGLDEFIDEAISTDGLGHYTEDKYTVVGDIFLKP